MEKKWKQWQILFYWTQKSLQTVIAATKLKNTYLLEDKLWQAQFIKKQTHHFADKGGHSQNYGFSSSHVWMWELDHKQGWVPMKWCFQTVMLEKTPESPLDSKEIKPISPKGNQPWIFIGSRSSNTLFIWCKDPVHWKKLWFWERLRGGGKGDERG